MVKVVSGLRIENFTGDHPNSKYLFFRIFSLNYIIPSDSTVIRTTIVYFELAVYFERFWCGNMKERDHWGDQDVDRRIILKWIFRKWEGVVGTGWSWLRIGTGGGRL